MTFMLDQGKEIWLITILFLQVKERLLKRGQSATDIVSEIVSSAKSIISSSLAVDALPTLDQKDKSS